MKSECNPGATFILTFSGIFIVDFDFCIQIAAWYRLRLEESLITKKNDSSKKQTQQINFDLPVLKSWLPNLSKLFT